jgi:hypothetical protein
VSDYCNNTTTTNIMLWADWRQPVIVSDYCNTTTANIMLWADWRQPVTVSDYCNTTTTTANIMLWADWRQLVIVSDYCNTTTTANNISNMFRGYFIHVTTSVVEWSEFLAADSEVRVRFQALPDFLRSSGSGTGSTQPREYN